MQWWWCCPGLLSPLVRSLLLDPAMPLWVSAMSLLELSALAGHELHDAVLLAQAEAEGMTLLSVDPALRSAAINPLW